MGEWVEVKVDTLRTKVVQLNSPLVVGLLLGGCMLLTAFILHELRYRYPAMNLKVAMTSPLPRVFLLISFLRLTILSTAFVIPQFLQTCS